MASIEEEIRRSRKAAEEIASAPTSAPEAGQDTAPTYDPRELLWGPEPDYTGIKTTGSRPYNTEYVGYIGRKLREAGVGREQRASILANIIEESGADPFAVGPGGFYGLIQWGPDRYARTAEKDPYKEIDNQVQYILDTLSNTTDRKSWTDGGKGSGYRSYRDAMSDFQSQDLPTAMKGYTLGHVRPTGKLDSYNNRLKVAQQVYEREKVRK